MYARCAVVAITLSAALGLAPEAKAAAARGAVLACRDQADIKRAFRPVSDKAAKDDPAYFRGKLSSGQCVQLMRDQKVDVDQRDGPLWCVRPSGALDCFWTHEKAIDLYPAPPRQPGEQPSQKKR
ncbi:hypothetical protein IY145_04930 [Methylosinus sp. H3A]|uniref:hypothetical protein n=1 Tax=Methylosinus sp. H3A TaxID=2785786 RepID=UPI0018C2B327|nr:hypothetical protein [Methylosinus sp. H3A]MBG0808716.1 hypothetical protein [Methylosinus sp. H3A]